MHDDILEQPSAARGGGGLQSQYLLERVRDEAAICDQPLPLLGMAGQQDRRPAQRLGRRGAAGNEETAAVLKVSPDTIMRDWKLARAWLLTELNGES